MRELLGRGPKARRVSSHASYAYLPGDAGKGYAITAWHAREPEGQPGMHAVLLHLRWSERSSGTTTGEVICMRGAPTFGRYAPHADYSRTAFTKDSTSPPRGGEVESLVKAG